ncbi:MAG: hypothetical protein ABIF71_06580 [Planctomycetota bacterium]
MNSQRRQRRKSISRRHTVKAEGAVFKKVMVWAIAGIALIAAVVVVKQLNPPERKAAAALVEEAGAFMVAPHKVDDLASLNQTYARLNDLKARLAAIPAGFGAESRAGQDLVARIDRERETLHSLSATLDSERRGREALDKVRAGRAGGTITPVEVVRQLRVIARDYPGTLAGRLAGEDVVAVEAEVRTAETARLEEARRAALVEAQAGRFKAAETLVNTCLNSRFTVLGEAEVKQAMEAAMTPVVDLALEQFNAAATALLLEARAGGDRTALKQRLKAAYDAIGFPELDEEYQRAQGQIGD